MKKLKKTIAAVCALSLLLCAGCAKKGENANPEANKEAKVQEEQTDVNTPASDEIEDGGEIDEEGNVIPAEESAPAIEEGETPEAVYQIPQVVLQYGEDGNITKETAVALLQRYTTEQLGIEEGEHQLLFAPDNTEVDSKPCYSIALKDATGATVGVFFISLDGSAAYKYDIDNQKYIRLP